jgi:hypothetical protein
VNVADRSAGILAAFAHAELPRLVSACVNNALTMPGVLRHVRLALSQVYAEGHMSPSDWSIVESSLEAVSRQVSALAVAWGLEVEMVLRLVRMPATATAESAERLGRNFSRCRPQGPLPTVESTGASALEMGHRDG